jgi:hypothetical protein
MTRLLVVKPRQVCKRSAGTGIHGHSFDPFATRLIHDAPDFGTRDALSIQRKNGHHGVTSGQRVDHLDHRRFVRRDLKLFAAHGNLAPKYVGDPSRILLKPDCGNRVDRHWHFLTDWKILK